MALKDTWIDKVDGKDYIIADDVNGIANAVIELEKNGVGNTGEAGEDGGYYTPSIIQKSEAIMSVSFTPSKTDMPNVTSEDITLPKGKDGTSVTIENVSENTEDGGVNIVTFSDGKILKVKNGATGAQGPIGETGAQGPQGEQGPQGPAGNDGLNAEMYSYKVYKIYSLADIEKLCAARSITSFRVVNCGEAFDIVHSNNIITTINTGDIYLIDASDGVIIGIMYLDNSTVETEEGTLIQWFEPDTENIGEYKVRYTPVLNGAVGKSAYEIAIKNGYEGTEEEWIAKINNPIQYEIVHTVETQEDLDNLISSVTTGNITFAVTGEVNVNISIADSVVGLGVGYVYTFMYTDGEITDWAALGAINTDGSMLTIYGEDFSEKRIFVMNGKDGKDGVSPNIKVEEAANKTGISLTIKNDGEEESDTFIPYGTTPNITIGTVETLAAGSEATASISGTTENPILNLGIPKGANGKDGADGGSETFELIGTYDISSGLIDVPFVSLKKIALYFNIPAGYSASSMSMLVYMTTNSANDPVLCHGHAVATSTKPIGGRIDIEGRPFFSVRSVVAAGDANTADTADPYALSTSQFSETIAPYHIDTHIQRIKLALMGGTLPSGSTVLLYGVKA